MIRRIAIEALETLLADFPELYSGMGRPSISPEMLLLAMLLQAFYSVRSERHLIWRLEFDLLFHWFVRLGIDEPVWGHSTFSKNHNRLLSANWRRSFLRRSSISRACASYSLGSISASMHAHRSLG